MRFPAYPDTPFTTLTASTYKSGFVVQTTGATSLPTLSQLWQRVEFAPNLGKAKILGLPVTHHFGFELDLKNTLN